jgi:hypothetical protein
MARVRGRVGTEDAATPSRRRKSTKAALTVRPRVCIIKSIAVPPAPHPWQCQRQMPLEAQNTLTGGVRPVWGP